MLRYFGATNVRIMSGGLKKWLSEGRPVFTGPYKVGEGLPSDGNFSFEAPEPERVIMDISKIHQAAGKLYNGASDWQITDARAAPRFNGEVQEAENMRAGHITGSTNVPFASLVDRDGCLKPDEQLREVFTQAGISL